MQERNPFLEDIVENPDDDAPRLIYSDWLEERDDPRGEFIRLSCRLFHLPPKAPEEATLRARLKELQQMYEAKWFAPLPRYVERYVVERGFVETVQVRRQQLENWNRILEWQPTIRDGVLRGAAGRLNSVLNAPNSARIRRLDIGRINPDEVHLLGCRAADARRGAVGCEGSHLESVPNSGDGRGGRTVGSLAPHEMRDGSRP
jgi:uncharacterized protein (TIGR02996 family)